MVWIDSCTTSVLFSDKSIISKVKELTTAYILCMAFEGTSWRNNWINVNSNALNSIHMPSKYVCMLR